MVSKMTLNKNKCLEIINNTNPIKEIGKVTEITTDEYDLAKIINAVPIVNFDDINYVAVLKRKEIEQ